LIKKSDIDGFRKDNFFQAQLDEELFDFQTTWGLFSPKEIDQGTKMLIRYLTIKEGDDCLDLGCGYGALGLYMASQSKTGSVTMLDKDFVAIDYANKNIELNKVANCQAILSNGFSQVLDKKVNLIVSNVPAKTGKELFYIFLADAYELLEPGGRFYVVTITGLRKFFEKGMKEVFGSYKKVKQGKQYTVAYAEK
jgi:16S rRNA (guanine1207-N2)-methyltransferase